MLFFGLAFSVNAAILGEPLISYNSPLSFLNLIVTLTSPGSFTWYVTLYDPSSRSST